MILTSTDIRTQVWATLAGDESFDVEAITEELMSRFDILFGAEGIDAIDSDEYWAIVERHQSGR